MRKRGGKTTEAVEDIRPRRRAGRDDSFTVGRTIAGASHRSHTMTVERRALRKQQKRKTVAVVILMILLFLALVAIVVSVVNEIRRVQAEEDAVRERLAVTPTVEVIDENAGGEISIRTKEFIVRLESDVKDYGFEIDHVVIPFQKARQVIVFIKGRTEYYKMSLDRGSAVQAEDMSRMARYLDDNDVKCTYVDLRVEGRAYYK